MNQIFDINRTIALLKLNLALNKKSLIITLAGYFAFVFVFSFFMAYHKPDFLEGMHYVFYYILFLGGTIFIAGRSFSHINNTEKSIAHLTLPASTFEKFIVPWFISSIFWAVVSIVSYIIVAIFINGIWSSLFGFQFEAFNPFEFNLNRRSLPL